MHPGTFAAREPGRAAVVMDDGRVLSYRELEQRSNQLAHVFRSAGLQVGDHVALCTENRPELFVCVWAALRSGLYYTPCSNRLTRDELQYIVDDCGAACVVVSAPVLDRLGDVDVPEGCARLVIGAQAPGWDAFDAALAAQPVAPIGDQAQGASMLYTSGTTGHPKGVVRPLPSAPYPSDRPGLERLLGLGEDAVYLSPAPLYHAAPLAFTTMIHAIGGTIVVQERFDAETALALVERHRVTVTQMVPTMFIRLLRLPDEVRHRYDLSSLRMAIHAAAPCPVEVKEQMIDWWGPIVHEYYAGTESICFVHCDSEEWLAHRGTVGRSLLSPVHILDEDGHEVPTGETGTVFFEGAGFAYHGDEEKTAASRDPRGLGWSTLGDIGHVDDDGYLYLTDRRADMIISGGVNVYPQEAENALGVHPAVADVAVFGIPDEDMGERVHAVVRLEPGAEPTTALAEELIAHCRRRLAGFKCPRAIEFRSELPRTDTGKLRKRLLRAEFWASPPPPREIET
jgi:long-chain acyl-CoA synthetase